MKYVVDSFSFHLIRQFEPKYDTIDFFQLFRTVHRTSVSFVVVGGCPYHFLEPSVGVTD